jgi:hypothetical protein
MAFTDQCDIFASFHEEGFNRVIDHVRQQRPSLFNYATADVAGNRELLCTAIKVHPVVVKRNNPLFTIEKPLPIPGSHFAVNFAAQLSDLKIDFHPGQLVALPPELSPPLKPQTLAIQLTVCGGIGCPPDEVVNRAIPPPTAPPRQDPKRNELPPGRDDEKIIVLPTRKLHCFCLRVFATAKARVVNYGGRPYLEFSLEGLEVVDIQPEGLENSIECLIKLLLKLVVLPGLRMLLQQLPLNLTQGATDLFPQPTNVTIEPQPTSPTLPNNPAIEDDQLKVFIKARTA